MNRSLIFFLLNFLSLASSQLLAKSEIDSRMNESTNKLVYNELYVAKFFSDFGTQIVNCRSSCSQCSSDTLRALDNLATVVQQQSTINNFSPYQPFNTCGDINFQIVTFDFYQRNLNSILRSADANISAINTQYVTLVQMASRTPPIAACVSSIFQQTIASFQTIQAHKILVATALANVAYFTALLNTFKKNYCPCLENVSWRGYNSTIENQTQTIENFLMQSQSEVFNATTLARSKLNSVSSSAFYFPSLKSTLDKISTISDYSTIVWSRVFNCNDALTRINFITWKRTQYLQQYTSAVQNQSLLTMYRASVEASSQSTDFKAAMNLAKSVEKALSLHASNVLYAYNKMSQIVADLSVNGGTFCSCEIQGMATTSSSGAQTTSSTLTLSPTTSTTVCYTVTTSLSSTTSSTSTTLPTASSSTTLCNPTTTVSTSSPLTTTSSNSATTASTSSTTTAASLSFPCGTFAYYDRVNDINGPAIRGFSVGTFYDGSTAYAGHQVGSGWCGDQNPIPSRIDITPGRAGGYASCAGVIFDPTTPYYLLNHPNFYWISANITTMTTYNNTVKIIGYRGFNFMIGRVQVGNYTSIGKVHYNQGLFGCWYQNSANAEIKIETGFDVLACR